MAAEHFPKNIERRRHTRAMRVTGARVLPVSASGHRLPGDEEPKHGWR